ERLPKFEPGVRVVGSPREVALERLARRRRVLERHVHAPERTVDATTEPAEVAAALERDPGGVELADRLVDAAEEKLALRVVWLRVRLALVARDDELRRVGARPRDRLRFGKIRRRGRAPRRPLQLLGRDDRVDVRDPVLRDRVREHIGRY